MIVHSSYAVFLIFILCIHTLNAINPAYFQQQQQWASLIEDINKQTDEQHSNIGLSETNQNNVDEDDDQLIKRNKYPNFHLSPLWLSRRTRTNRFYGKPLWISRTG